MIKVGERYPIAPKRFRMVLYTAVEFDKDGWADASEALPIDGDLVFIKVDGEPRGNGWCWGKIWEGTRLKKNERVSHWKRNTGKFPYSSYSR